MSQPLIIIIAGNLTNLVPQLVVMILVPLQHPVQVTLPWRAGQITGTTAHAT